MIHTPVSPAWGQHGVLYNNRTLMTAFPFRSCWKRHLPHVALGSIFSFARSDLKAWPVLPSQKDNLGVAPCLHAEGPCATTAAYGCLPRRMIGLIGLIAGFRVR